MAGLGPLWLVARACACTHPLGAATFPQGPSDVGPMDTQPQLAAAPEAAPGAGKKPKTHWSGAAKGQAFTLEVTDVPGPNGKKVVVKAAMRRNADDGLTESTEPGWTFKAKGAGRPTQPSAPCAPLSTPLLAGRSDGWRGPRRQRWRPQVPCAAGGARRPGD